MIDYELRKNKLYISHFDDVGKIKFTKINIPESEMYRWRLSKHADNPSVVAKVKASSSDKYSFNQFGQLIEKSYGSPDRYRIIEILHKLPEKHKESIFGLKPPLMWFSDIETEVLDEGFPDVNDPKGRVLTNAFCNNRDNKIYLQTIKDLSEAQKISIQKRLDEYFSKFGSKFEFVHLYNDTEKRMLDSFMNDWVPKMPILTGWNFVKFDWAYLINRSIRLGVNTDKTSPTKVMSKVSIKDKYNPDNVTTVIVPKHRVIFDYMTIWEKWDRTVKIKSSSRLDYVASQAFGVKKFHYQGTLMDMYRNNFEDYCFYNIVDTILVRKIDEVLNTYSCMAAIAAESRTSISSAIYASQVLEPMFLRAYHDNGQKFVKDYSKTYNKEEKYSGGFVMEPGTGIKPGVLVYDFESLFPMLVAMFNMGVDTYMGDVNPDDSNTYICKTTGNIMQIADSMCNSAIGAVFNMDGYSVPSEVINNLFDARIYNKHEANNIDEEVNMLEQMLN